MKQRIISSKFFHPIQYGFDLLLILLYGSLFLLHALAQFALLPELPFWMQQGYNISYHGVAWILIALAISFIKPRHVFSAQKPLQLTTTFRFFLAIQLMLITILCYDATFRQHNYVLLEVEGKRLIVSQAPMLVFLLRSFFNGLPSKAA